MVSSGWVICAMGVQHFPRVARDNQFALRKMSTSPWLVGLAGAHCGGGTLPIARQGLPWPSWAMELFLRVSGAGKLDPQGGALPVCG